ncbi:DUF5074 domain-containing protein [Myroides pelagicus]|uniref:DUF5074 domain-containing protein n=1 Tax=Myroides pelagicus TaxID=270914 RepID=A0A7K1GK87_9FLAO|nr:DUF5074 domain-containing protein [Myroides pelagicus]MTH28929.1 DUF5074 domain-containing protein [Myroides pelagicus]
MNTKYYFKGLSIAAIALFFSCSSDDKSTTNEEGFRIIPADEIIQKIQPTGFYIANEDWFGTDNGSVNFINANYSPSYRIYREANPGQKLGVTTQYATTYGKYYYIVSKMDKSLVVTDKDFKEVKSLTDINGDGRAFVGATPDKGYISTSNGITIFDIKNLTTTGVIPNITTQTGNMAVANGLLFAVSSDGKLHIIDITTDQVIHSLEDSYAQLTLDHTGILWVGNGNKLSKIDTKTIDKADLTTFTPKNYDLVDTSIVGQWGAWNAGSMTASNDGKYIYWNANGGAWSGGNTIAQFDTETGTVNPKFYDLGNDDLGNKLSFYGAGLRVDPHTDNLVLTIKRDGYGSNASYNWTRIISPQGTTVQNIFLRGGTADSSTLNADGGYFWFPAMPFFQDNNVPQIFTNQIILKSAKEFAIPMDKFFIDQDSPFALINKSVTNLADDFGTITLDKRTFSDNGKEVIKDCFVFTTNEKTGKSNFTLTIESNGFKAEKNIEVWVR